MIRNYFKIALRNLKRNKRYVFINTFGMGIALTCCMTAYLLIAYNIEFDNYFKDDKVKNIVKVMQHLKQPNGQHYQQLVAPVVMASRAAQEISGVEQFTRYCSESGYMSNGDKVFSENIYFADAAIFDMIDLGLKSGSYKNFESQKSIFLSEKLATKYFFGEDPIGKTLTVEFRSKKYEVFVGGVLERLPLNSTFNHDALMRIETYLEVYDIQPDNWNEARETSVLFKIKDIDQRKQIGKLMDTYVSLRNEAKPDSKSTSFELLPFKEPLTPNDVNQSYLHLRIPSIALFIFMTLGVIILLIACFNLTNTTIALTGKRLKEIGVRKVVGSSRIQIANQFLLEMVITIALAITVGVLMAQIIVPMFAAMWGLQYGLQDLNGINVTISLIIMLFSSALLAGIYPALFNSKLSPVILLKGGLKIKGTNLLTRTLLVIQFSLSVIVLIAGIVFSQNAAYQQKISFGYDTKKIITVSIQGSQEYEALKNAIQENPKVLAVAAADNHFGPYSSYYRPVKIDTSQTNTDVYEIGVNYFNVVGLNFVTGRDFIGGSQTDYESAAIVDENFVKNHDLTNPIDTRVLYKEEAYRIIGVVKNHLTGFKNGNDKDHFFRVAKPEQYHVLVVRANTGNILETQNYIKTQWKKLFPDKPFQSDLQEDIVFRESNEYNKNLKQIFFFLTILGCLLSASGIYALANLNILGRIKEIGVRKVLGAEISSIVQLVNKEFVIILALSAVIGGLGGFLLTDALLSNLYAQRIGVSVLSVVVSGLLVFIIGIATTTTTILRAAKTNPTDALRIQ